jgi:predicted nucleotidyltransferase
VTGSILLDIHQDFSDVDLLIYGVQHQHVVRKTLLRLYQSHPAVTRFDGNILKEWCLDKAKTYPFSEEEAAVIYRRKWGRGLIHRTKFSMHPVKLDEEVSERYGDRVYLPKGIVTISSRVSDASESCFIPSIYQVEDVKVLEGTMVDDVKEVASYDGFFCDIAYPNERIIVKGKLEKVVDKRRDVEYHRVLVGSPEAMGDDYIKPVDVD